ncbi:serine/threonine protein kinase [Nostoc sp. CENA67]|uniref:Serine/threonine protein kinase n=1 Tax=Amazonocrinis nigriterrae CENA67 TaxID=2794033 RepID=A0A8J7HZ94_9NOST|nr:serine/threonine-protein kinase [Amazonocrinis nigriterrae]MBH8566177.1 serine/threonine protein kinase [Amazonocrinis nigriterrae CENA67]
MLLQERYRLLKLISKGGFCKTFLAVDEGQSPPVYCIVQELSLPNETPQLFEQKAKQLKELGKHPQIPALLAYFQNNQYFYLVQEFIEGNNLAQVIENKGAFNETQIWQLLKELLPVLKYISDRNIIHRDIKPVNIIYRNADKNVVLVDFGVAKLVIGLEELTDENSIGSPEYAAPEQAKGKAIFASDLYSLGVTCIYLLTQIPPFDLFNVANNCWVWREYVSKKISDRLAQILDKLIQNPVNQRFQSADEVMEAMGIEFKIKNTKLKIQNNPWQCLHTFTGHSNSLGSVNALSISPDGNILASVSDDKIIRLWNLNTKKLLASFSAHSQAVTSVAFSPNGEILATASDDKTIKLWHVDTLAEIFTLCGHSHVVKSVAFSPNDEILASGSWDKKIKLWDVNTGAEICTLTGHKLQVSSIAFSPDGQLLASASFDRTIHLWQLREIQNRPCYALLGILSGHTRAVLTVAFSPDGKILATGSDDNTIKLWDVNTGQLISTLSSHSWSVMAVAFTADGQTLISASWDKTVKLWRVNTAEEIVTLSGHVDSVTTVAVSQVAQLIASGSKDKTIKLWQSVEQQES